MEGPGWHCAGAARRAELLLCRDPMYTSGALVFTASQRVPESVAFGDGAPSVGWLHTDLLS